MRRRQNEVGRHGVAGFTLIELMVVVVVVGILASVAVPSYQDAVRKGRRGQAKADLVDLAQLAERYRTVNATYVGFAIPTGANVSPRTGTSWYDVSIQGDPTVNTIEFRAAPKNAQRKDTKCMTLSINQAGQKGIVGGSSTAANCW